MPSVLHEKRRCFVSSSEEGGEEGMGDSHAPTHHERGGPTGVPGDGVAGDACNRCNVKRALFADDSSEGGEFVLSVHPAVLSSAAVVAASPAAEGTGDGLQAVVSAATELEPTPSETVLLDGCAATSVDELEGLNASPEDEKPALAKSSQASSPDARGGPPSGTDENSKEDAKELATDVAGDKRYTVLKPLNLGLALKLGSSYTVENLRSRCRGDEQKLLALDGFLALPAVLSEADTKGPKASRARPSKTKHDCCSEPPSKKIKSLTLAKPTPARRQVATPGELTAKFTKAAALPLSSIGSKILATVFGDPSTAAISRPESRTSDAFVVGQTVWYLDASRPPWPAQILAVPSDGQSPAYRVRPLGDDRPETQVVDGIHVHPDALLTFVRGDALALALVADKAEMLHAGFVDGQAKDAEDRSTPTESSALATEKASQSADRMMDSFSGDDDPAVVCDALVTEDSQCN